MADIFTGTATGFVNNYPETTTAALGDIRLEQMKQTSDVLDAIKDARHELLDSTGVDTDRLADRISEMNIKNGDRFFDIGRDTQDIRAQIISAQQQVVAGFMGAAKDAEINALKTQVEMAKQSTYLSDKIDADGEKTRALVNSLKEQDLNRMLIERNTLLSEERFGRRYWSHGADQGQWAALNSQLQAFQSQLQETRQGMVNFGTMAGVGQTSTSNNVR
jgi:hypothetical protein